MGEGNMAIADDLTDLDEACLDEFGSLTLTHTPQVGDAESITVIPEESAEPEGTWPGATLHFSVPASGITTAPTIGDTVTRDSVDYRIQAVVKELTGLYAVECRKI